MHSYKQDILYAKQVKEIEMFQKCNANVTPTDAKLRIIFGNVAILYAFYIDSIVLGIFALILFYTAFSRFCFTYYLLNINKRLSKTNYYLSLLPKYNASPVFIFDADKKLLFQNDNAKKVFTNVSQLSDLHYDKCNIIQHASGKYFQVSLQNQNEENLTLVYCNDITKMVELNQEIEETQKEIIYAMGEIGETRSKETGNHVKRVALYSEKLALLYGLDTQTANKLKMASPMHDIGKVGIEDAILNAPRKLNEAEFEIMKTHAQLGYNMLKYSNKPILQAAAIVAGEHHEKWDGSGYPRGLKEEEIHIFGRITAVADVFDALGSERVYKKAWKIEDIVNLFKEQSGKHFEPKLVTLLLENLDTFLAIRDKYRDIYD